MKNNQRGFIGIVVVIIITLGLTTGGVYIYKVYSSKARYEEIMSNPKAASALLREDSRDAKFIENEIEKRVLDKSEDETERIGLIRVLGESNTPDSFATLIKLVHTAKEERLIRDAIHQMIGMGKLLYSKEHANEMARIAKEGWLANENVFAIENSEKVKTALYFVYANILAETDNAEAIIFLRDEAQKGGTIFEAAKANKSITVQVALESSKSIKARDNSSVAVLVESLKLNDPTLTEFVWSGEALAASGFEIGARTLVEWAKDAPDSCAELARDWLGNFKDSHSAEFMKNFSPLMKFRSQIVKNAVIEASKKYYKQSSSSLDTEMSQSTNIPASYEKVNYMGKYTFTETGVVTTSKVASYTLNISENKKVADGVLTRMDTMGEYKTTEVMRIKAVNENGVLKIIFDSFAENSVYHGSGDPYVKNDTLFTLVMIDRNKFRINWNRMTPVFFPVDDLINNFFVRIY